MAFKNPFQGWTLVQFLVVSVSILVLIQVFGLLFNEYLEKPILLGPIFLIIIVATAVLFSFTLVRKQWKFSEINRKDILALLIITALTILALIYFRGLVPEVFERSFDLMHQNIQSIFPLP